jgi:hypothetical protein
MMSRNRIFLLCVLLLQGMFVLAQQAPKSFSVEPPKFIDELEDYIKSAKIESSSKVIEEFSGYWMAGKLSAQQQRAVITSCNNMLMKRFRVNPEFESYLATLNAMISSGQQQKIESWQKMVDAMMGKTRKNYLDFLSFTRGLFSEIILSENANKKWRATSAEFDLSLDKNEPIVKFSKPFTLVCYTQGDTIFVKNTTGSFNAVTDLWTGDKGHIDWARTFLDTNKVYADFGRYKIDLKKSEFTVDTVTFYNKNLFQFPIKGRLMEKAYMAYAGGDRALSPRFESFEKSFDFPQFKGEVKFLGGFGMKGTKIIGIGTEENPASFVFMYKGKPKMKVQALEFTIGEQKTITEKASVIIFVDNDSIYHPQMTFVYDLPKKIVTMNRDANEPITAAPFLDTYHRIEFYVDELRWNLDNAHMNFLNLNPERVAVFESFNFYRLPRYDKVQGILSEHPLYTIRQFSYRNDTTWNFHIEDFAAFLGLKKQEVVALIIDLNDNGFLLYNPRTGDIKLRDKAFEWFRARNNKTDYDVLRFTSTIDGSKRPHAMLNFVNHDLNVQGVTRFIFSDSQSVYVEPTDQQINIRKNRDVDFSGHLHAGRMDFFSKVGPDQGFLFSYDQFKVNFTNVELQLTAEDSSGRQLPLRNRMKNVTGKILIDKPRNKRGMNGPRDEYPILESVKNANMFYDYISTGGKVDYDPLKFYFDIDPFTIDSLDNFDINTMTFDGTLHAGGIMKDFREVLRYMPDTSLGFKREMMEYDLYINEGKSKGKGAIALTLSDNGFHGNGGVTYLASQSNSADYFLHLDSSNASLRDFELKRTDIYPSATGKNMYQRWIAYQDTMFIGTTDEDMAMFEGRAYLKGNAVLTPKTLYGDGRLSWDNAELFSSRFNFSPVTTKTDKGYFRLASADPGKFAIIINDVNAFVDFDKRFAEFKVNKVGQIVDLPYNQYQMVFSDYRWNMDAKTIDMKARDVAGSAQNMQKNFFRSIHPDQDSLIFNAGNATYFLDDYLVVAEKVPYIHTADARVIPDSNRVYIEPNALMRTLKNSTIYTDTIKRFHTIVRSNVDVLGRKNFRGNGFYSYTDRTKKNFEIYFENIYVNKFGRTSASGPISDTMNFTLSPKIQFKGTATLISNDRNMEFDGYILPVHTLPYPQSEWFRHTQRINPDSVFIRYDDLRNEEKLLLFSGAFLSTDSTHAYEGFFNRKRNYSDLELTRATGVLFYDDKAALLKAGSWDKLLLGKLVGNAIFLNDKTQSIYTEGKINLGLPKGRFTVKSGGIITGTVRDTLYVMDAAMLLDIPLPEAALKLMSDTIFEAAAFSDELKYNNDRIIKSILEIMDYPDAEGKGASEKDLNRQVESMREDNVVRMSSELTKTFLMSDVKMVWNTRKRSFTSKGKIGLTAVGKLKVDRRINAKIEIIKKRSGDEVNILIEPMSGTWFFFKFFRNQMFVISSNASFNQIIKEQMEKMSTGDYKLRFGSVTSKNNFQRGEVDEEDQE